MLPASCVRQSSSLSIPWVDTKYSPVRWLCGGEGLAHQHPLLVLLLLHQRASGLADLLWGEGLIKISAGGTVDNVDIIWIFKWHFLGHGWFSFLTSYSDQLRKV
jgi:hypothetical protein